MVAKWQRIGLQCRRQRFSSWVRKIPWRGKWQLTPVLLPGKSMDGGAWQVTVHGVSKSWTQLSNFTYTSLIPDVRFTILSMQSVALSAFTLLYSHHQHFRSFSSSPDKTRPIKHLTLYCPIPGTTVLLCLNLTTLDMSYKCNNNTF